MPADQELQTAAERPLLTYGSPFVEAILLQKSLSPNGYGSLPID